MRALAIAWALVAAACTSFYEAGAGPDDESAAGACAIDDDCVLAGPTCCDCPTYATSVTSGWAESCANVDCPTPGGACTGLEARCQDGACVATCGAAACDLSCPSGFAADAAGCLVCACAPATTPAECERDDQCVQTRADCCGCARGGTDTAVPIGTRGGFDDGLGCPADGASVACPEVTTCDPAAIPRCLAGQCQLATAGEPPPTLPQGACGRPDLPPCPAGSRCVLNQSDEAGPLGVGVCVASKR